jgi:surfeit locus 1 family protein
MRRPGWFSVVAVLAALGVLVALGTWQLQRMQWKEALIADIASRRQAQPLSIASYDSLAKPPLDAEYRPITVTGHFDHAGEQYFFATDDGRVGFHVYTPLILADGRALLVNRGFVPLELQDPQKRIAGQPAGEITLTGLLRTRLAEKPSSIVPDNEPAKKLFFWKDIDQMAKNAGIAPDRLVDVFVDADATPNPGGWPKGGVTQIDLPNNHLSYALTWYGLAAAMLVIASLALRRRARSN